MKCVICKSGETSRGHTTLTFERGPSLLVYKQVPAQVCNNCGETYLDDAAASRLLQQAEAAAAAGAELEVHPYSAA